MLKQQRVEFSSRRIFFTRHVATVRVRCGHNMPNFSDASVGAELMSRNRCRRIPGDASKRVSSAIQALPDACGTGKPSTEGCVLSPRLPLTPTLSHTRLPRESKSKFIAPCTVIFGAEPVMPMTGHRALRCCERATALPVRLKLSESLGNLEHESEGV